MKRNMLHRAVIFGLGMTVILCSEIFGQSWQSNIVFFGGDGKLHYVADTEGNRIPDFSYAGYKNGEKPIPTVSVVKTIDPIAGDNTQNIQDAIDFVAGLPLDGNGFRGALLLDAGMYRVSGTIRINESGIILRGVGEGSDSSENTIIFATGDSVSQPVVIVAGGGNETEWKDQVTGTQTDITTDTVYVGARAFQVADASKFTIGDNIIIYHPCSEKWLQAINYGGTDTNLPWTVGLLPLFYNRFITEKNGNTITIDAPVFNTLVRNLSQSYIYKYARTGLKTNIGIENLRVHIYSTDVTTNRSGEEHHAWDAINFFQVEDAWAQHCTVMHFVQGGFKMSTATRVTIDSCSAIDPISRLDIGERRYNYDMYHASQLILVSNCRATNGRHDFVSNGESGVSGCVFLDSQGDSTHNISEGHRHWSQGLLYDNIFIRRIGQTALGAYNRGSSGTSHGWSAAHFVFWNCNAETKNIFIQKPPTAQNYAIGCIGNVTGASPPAPFVQPDGYIEGANLGGLNPRSLYLAQLAERLQGITPVEDYSYSIPEVFHLEQNYPNPFNPNTVINYTLTSSVNVRLIVYDLLGRQVDTLVDGIQNAGSHRVEFHGARFNSGIYLACMKAGNKIKTVKLLLMK